MTEFAKGSALLAEWRSLSVDANAPISAEVTALNNWQDWLFANGGLLLARAQEVTALKSEIAEVRAVLRPAKRRSPGHHIKIDTRSLEQVAEGLVSDVARLRDAVENALKCTPHIIDGDIVYDCGNPWEMLDTALLKTAPWDERAQPLPAPPADTRGSRMTQPAELRALIERATLPWVSDPDERPGMEWNFHIYDTLQRRIAFMSSGEEAEDWADLIVAAVNALPGHLDQIDQQAAEIKRLREVSIQSVWDQARENHQLYSATSSRENDIRFLALGLTGEAGELANYVKKRWRDGDGHDEAIKFEIADVCAYAFMLADTLGVSAADLIETIAHKQQVFIAKMKARAALAQAGEQPT